MKIFRFITLISGMAISLLFAGIVIAQGSELKFTATVFSINPTDTDSGVVTISVQAIQVPIQVNGDTEIESGGTVLTLSDLTVGDRVKVDAFFSDAGITADEITIIMPRDPSFNFKGEISDVTSDAMLPEDVEFTATPVPTTSVGYTSITILGTDVFINDDTRIYDGNPPWDSLDPASLMAGDPAIVTGGFNGVLWAERILVGYREVGEIELDGTITSLDDGQFMIDIQGGGSTTVIVNDDTLVSGDLAVGLMVEVEGMLNTELAVIASEVVLDIDGDGDGDDDNDRLRPTLPPQAKGLGLGLNRFHNGFDTMLNSESSELEAIVSIRDKVTPGVSQKSFSVKLMNAPADTTFTIVSSFGGTDVEFGSVITDDNGEAELSYRSQSNRPDLVLGGLIPDGLSLRDITSVQVMSEGAVVLEQEI